MATFKDIKGDDWDVVLTVGAVAAVKRETGINLALADKESSWVSAIFSNDGKLVEVLWVVCARQAKERNISPEEFGYRFDGATVRAAGQALAMGVSDFFPLARIGTAIRENWTKLVTRAEDQALAELDRLTATGSNGPTSAPASSESIPAG